MTSPVVAAQQELGRLAHRREMTLLQLLGVVKERLKTKPDPLMQELVDKHTRLEAEAKVQHALCHRLLDEEEARTRRVTKVVFGAEGLSFE